MAEMVERVARAIAKGNGAIWGGPRGEDDPDFDLMRIFYLSMARAAIEAMREPTKAMSEAGVEAEIPGAQYGDGTFRESSVDEKDVPVIWRSMIDAALTE